MQHTVVGLVRGYGADDVTGFQLLPFLYDDRGEVAVDGDVCAMAHKYVLCSRELEDGCDFSVEDTACPSTWFAYIVYSLVVQRNIFKTGNIVGAETP